MIGKRIGHYEVLELLGTGGMGSVYRARDVRLGRDVAIKLLSAGATEDSIRLERFAAEARLASSLNHPNIISLFDIGESDDGPYIVTELVEGQTLKEAMMADRLALDERLTILLQAADGLAKAHEAGIVHRDIKPANMMITPDGLVKILDFGVAKLHADAEEKDQESRADLTQTGTVIGTAAYMPPERVYGAAADARSDVFSLGVVAHELLLGQHPFLRDSVSATLRAIVMEDPNSTRTQEQRLPAALLSILRKAMAKEPEDRYPNAGAFAAELRAWVSGNLRNETNARPRLHRPFASGWWVAGVGALILLMLVVKYWPRTSRQDSPIVRGNALRVAVLPAENLVDDAELREARVGEILADVFVHALSDVDDVYVVSPLRLETLARSRGRSLEEATGDFAFARELCEEAGATAILNSSLSRVGSGYVLTAALTGIESQDVLGTFRADSSDPARLLTDMGEDLQSAIQERFDPSDASSSASGIPTASMRAYTHYIKGRDAFGLAQWERAREELEAAVELDPRMGLAWSELACTYSFLELDPAMVETAQSEAEKHMEGLSRKDRWWIELNGMWLRTENGQAMIEQIELYLEDYPDDREAIFYAGLAAQWLNGNCREALDWFERAYELTPFYHPVTKGLVDCHLELGETDEAVDALERYLALSRAPSHGRDWAEQRLDRIRRKN